MSGHVVLNLLNFRNDFNKFNNTGALILDSIYSYDAQSSLKSRISA